MNKLAFSLRMSIALALAITFSTTRVHAQLLAPEYVQDELLVQFRTTAAGQHLADALLKAQLSVKEHLPANGHRPAESGLVLMRTHLSVDRAIAALHNHPAVQFAEPNVIKAHQAVSNDPNYKSGKLWGMYGDLTSPANQFGSQAGEAWANGNVGSTDLYVAVLDEGIDINHPDLAPNIGRNPGETGLDAFGRDKATNGIDDDGNGYIDDLYGYDFLNNDNTVFDGGKDKDDHGTHVAGTIGAVGGNALGVAGMCWNIKILSGKFMSSKGGTAADEIRAIEYFIDLKQRHRLQIVAFNASYGGGKSLAEQIALIRAAKAGILLCAAAGNTGIGSASFPAGYDTTLDALNADGTVAESAAAYDSVLSVAAIDSQGALPSWSNRSATRVDLAAPGVDILSTLPGARYGTMYGTSMATPHVTGACILYFNTHRDAQPWDIRAAILSQTLPTASLAGKTVTGGRLNVGGF
jgi:hypothetical protein